MKRSMQVLSSCLLVAGAAVLLSGCGRTEATSHSPPPAAASDSRLLLADEPAGAASVIEVRETAQDQDSVVVVGRVGGSADPWVDGRAAFSIVDPSLVPCSEKPGDSCPVPWDYCCDTDRLPAAHALVKLTDAEGRLIARDAREVLPLKELQTVVVQGTAQRDDAGNLTVLATGVFVRP